jgi:sugar lactone lactonase YvrE
MSMSYRLTGFALLALIALTACGRSVSGPPATAGYRIFLEEGFNGGSERITVRDSASGALERELPLGTPAPDWSRYYTVTSLAGSGRLTALDPASGRTMAQVAIPAGFGLPSLGYQGPTAGLSPSGKWLALTDNGRATSGKLVTSFLVGASSLTGSFKTVRVNGDFAFDALSDTGQSLYLIQRMGDPNHYQVRLLDVASGTLTEHPVVDKRESGEPMNGIRGDSVADAQGAYVFTVYARQAGPFIHALPLDQPFAWCIDLPAKSASDLEEQFHWSLAFNQQRSILYAINSSSGRIAEIAPDSLPKVERTAQVALNPSRSLLAGFVTEADAKGARIGGAAVSAGGRTLFALGSTGIVAIDTASLKVRQRILDGESVDSLRLSTDGRWLYAAGAAASKVWQIDPSTGAVSGEIAGTTNPWAILWAAPK